MRKEYGHRRGQSRNEESETNITDVQVRSLRLGLVLAYICTRIVEQKALLMTLDSNDKVTTHIGEVVRKTLHKRVHRRPFPVFLSFGFVLARRGDSAAFLVAFLLSFHPLPSLRPPDGRLEHPIKTLCSGI